MSREDDRKSVPPAPTPKSWVRAPRNDWRTMIDENVVCSGTRPTMSCEANAPTNKTHERIQVLVAQMIIPDRAAGP